MKISVHYEENIVNSKDYKSIKVGLTVHSDKDLKNLVSLEEHYDKLNMLAKNKVREKLSEIKVEKQPEIWK